MEDGKARMVGSAHPTGSGSWRNCWLQMNRLRRFLLHAVECRDEIPARRPVDYDLLVMLRMPNATASVEAFDVPHRRGRDAQTSFRRQSGAARWRIEENRRRDVRQGRIDSRGIYGTRAS